MQGRLITRVLMASTAGLIALMPVALPAQSTPENVILAVLGRWWSPYGPPINTDHLTTSSRNETPWGFAEGSIFYVPKDSGSGRHTLYRLYSGVEYNHMDSLIPGEQGFGTDFVLGYPFDEPVSGTASLVRWVGNGTATTGDRMMSIGGVEDWSGSQYQVDTSFSPNGSLGYGYPRFKNACEVPVDITNGLDPEDADYVRLRANKVAGGIINELQWDKKQFVNNFDFGRQIQIALFKHHIPGHTADNSDNPTEGGDTYSCNMLGTTATPDGWAHGSPLISFDVGASTLSTTTVPLQFLPASWGGGPDNPVAWTGTFSKTVQIGLPGHPRIIRWTTRAHFPTAATGVYMNLVAAHLVTDFNRLYIDDADQPVWTAPSEFLTAIPTMPAQPIGCADFVTDPNSGVELAPLAGAIILATNNGSHALAMYQNGGENNTFGGCKIYYQGRDQDNHPVLSPGIYGRDSNMITVGSGGWFDSMPQGDMAPRTLYLVVGTLASVRDEIRWLRWQGY
jgi:hypothetical protein